MLFDAKPLLTAEYLEALHEPYVLAFEPSFVEIRHIESGAMQQVIQGQNLRLLFADTPPSITTTSGMHHNTYPGYVLYFSRDAWIHARRNNTKFFIPGWAIMGTECRLIHTTRRLVRLSIHKGSAGTRY